LTFPRLGHIDCRSGGIRRPRSIRVEPVHSPSAAAALEPDGAERRLALAPRRRAPLRDAVAGRRPADGDLHDEEQFAKMFATLMDTMIHTALFSGFCGTRFADTFQEATGLPCADRTPKIPIEQIARVTRMSRTHTPGGV
jgi:hypothetical protein